MKYLLSLLAAGVISFGFGQKVWTLQDCLDYATQNNITVKKSKITTSSAEINLQQAKFNVLPSIAGTASGNLANGSSIDPITSDFVSQTILSNSFGVNANVSLFQGGLLKLQIDKNKLLVQQSELYEQQAENNIYLSVMQTYLQALYYQEGIQSAEYTLNSTEEELSQSRTKFENGGIAQLALAEVETQYAQNKYNVVNARNLFNQQVLKLKQLLELDPSTDFQIEKMTLEDVIASIPDKIDVYKNAAENLPDVKIYDIQNEILKNAVSIAKTGYYPTLALRAGLSTGYSNTMSLDYSQQLRNNFNKSLGLTLNIPIFSKRQNVTNVKLAKLEIEQNELDKTSSMKTLYFTIETAWQNAVAYNAQLESSKTARDNAKLAYELAQKKYEFGGLTNTELAVSRNTYLTNEQTHLQTKYMAALYSRLLQFYQGNN